MEDDRSESRRRVQWYRPDEIVIVAHVPRDVAASEQAMQTDLHKSLRKHAADHVAAHPTALRSSVFNAPGADNSLVFFFQRLTRGDSPKEAKVAVQRLHERLNDIGGADIDAIGVMPHW